jgi:mycothiol synthase
MEIRAFGQADFDEVFDLLDSRSRAAFGVSEQNRDVVRQWLAVPGTDGWVAVDDGRVVGHATLSESHDAAITASSPELNDQFLSVVEDRARERGFDNIVVITPREDEPLDALVRRSGFTADREVWRMWRTLQGELPEARWPDGVTVRTYTDADGERVHALLDAAYVGWDTEYVAQSHDGWLAFMTQHDEFDPALWFLVERDGELVGCALHWKEHQQRGWVKDIVVTESERGHGLGTSLLHHALRAYAARGVDQVGLKVDSTNPTGAPQLYKRVGFTTDRRYGTWIKRL